MSAWENTKELNIRQKIAIHLIILAIGIIEPYGFKHQFDKELDALKKLISGDAPEGKKK